MSLSKLKEGFLNSKLQVLQIDKDGLIIDNDNCIFKVDKNTLLVDVHPFFYSIIPELTTLTNSITYPCVNVEISGVEKIIDIEVQKINDEIFVTLIDFTEHYKDSHPLVQEKNEASIAKNKLAFEQEVLYAKEEFKNDFLAHLNHEIRNPLNSLLGFAEVLSQSKLTFQQKETVNVINKTGTYIKVLMDDLLDISKIETGLLSLKNIPFNLNNIVVNIVKHFQIKQQKIDIDLSYLIEKTTPIKLFGDPTRLNQILYNLLSNAYRNTSKGHIKIMVSVNEGHDKNCIINFKISDSGKGISSQNIAKIFDSYSQLQIEKIKPLGDGLGLKIVQDLVHLMKGTIGVKSVVDSGTEFSIDIPFETRNLKTKRKTVPKGSGLMLSKRVLAVENDDISQMLLMKQFLSNDSGYYLEIASNGEQAKQMLEKKSYDIVMLKSKLEDCEGIDIVKFIRNHKDDRLSATPIIFASGKAMIAEQEETLNAGASAFLKKPYNQKQLFRLLEKTIITSY